MIKDKALNYYLRDDDSTDGSKWCYVYELPINSIPIYTFRYYTGHAIKYYLHKDKIYNALYYHDNSLINISVLK